MHRKLKVIVAIAGAIAALANSNQLVAGDPAGENRNAFKDLPSQAELTAALKAVVAEPNRGPRRGGGARYLFRTGPR